MRQRVEPKTWKAYQSTACEGRPSREVAKVLGMTVGGVYKAKSTVLRMLQEELRKLDDGCDARNLELKPGRTQDRDSAMNPCSTPQQLERFLLDQLESPESEAVEAHIEECDRCQHLLEQMTKGRESVEPSPSSRENDERVAACSNMLRRRDLGRTNPDERPPVPNGTGAWIEGSEGEHEDDGSRSLASPGIFPRINGLRIIREIGRGGMGIVYEAEDQTFEPARGAKLLPFHAHALPKQAERFKREAQAAARLHHTNIVPIFGVGEQGGYHYYLMQYIEGFGLDAVLDELRRLREAASASQRNQGSRTGRRSWSARCARTRLPLPSVSG